jgi:hypothetical protein
MIAPPPAPTKKAPLHPVAKACLAAPLLALGLGLAFSVVPAGDAKVAAGAVRILLLMVGFTFAFVALLGSRGAGRERLARYALAGLAVNGVYLFLSAVMFPGTLASTRAQMAHHRRNAITVSARESPPLDAMNSGVIHYTNLDFSKPGEALDGIAFAARGKSGEDAAVLRAWSGVLTQLLAAHLEVKRTAQALTAADVLNPATITNGSRTALGDQFIARRLLANRYGSALHRWEHALISAGQRYADELNQQPIAPERAAIEGQRLATAAGIRIKPLIQLCVAEQKVASHYSRAVSAMESCHPFNRLPAPNDRPDLAAASGGRDFTEQLAKLEHAKQIAIDLRQHLVGTR